MNAEIICIGDELLIGQVLNTNAAKIGEMLNMAGIEVIYSCAIKDRMENILFALSEAEKRSELIIITGGLGPTKDDITKCALCEFFKVKLVENQDALENVNALFSKRGRELTELNRKQAEVPEGCIVIRNNNGTAPGMWMKRNGKNFISMPGVPYETMAMIEEFVIPRLKKENELPFIYHRTILTQGIGESFLAEKIEKWEDSLAPLNIKLAYLPSVGMVRLRLSCSGKNKEDVIEKVQMKIEELYTLIEKYIYGEEEYGKPQPKLEAILGGLLLAKEKNLALAESCTGGYISHLITSVAGSSNYFNGGVVPYQNELKQVLLGVADSVFTNYGAVSEECVKQMAVGAMRQLRSDYSIAVSGIAGPTGGTEEKPVGTVWIAWASKTEVVAEKFVFGNNRGRNIELTAINALNGLIKKIKSGF